VSIECALVFTIYQNIIIYIIYYIFYSRNARLVLGTAPTWLVFDSWVEMPRSLL